MPRPNETVLGTFTRGLVYFSFIPSGPDHKVWMEVGDASAAATFYRGSGMMLTGPRDATITVQGSAINAVNLMTTPGGTGGGFGLQAYEESWGKPFWVAFLSTNDSGPAPMRVGMTGPDVRVSTPPAEADAWLLTEEEWTGTLDARAGGNEISGGNVGAAAVVERSLSFTTHNGTLLFFNLGLGSGARIDDMTVKNSTTTLTWTGASSWDAGIGASLPGQSQFSELTSITGPADAWELSIRASARIGTGRGDYVLVSDVSLPPDLRGR